ARRLRHLLHAHLEPGVAADFGRNAFLRAYRRDSVLGDDRQPVPDDTSDIGFPAPERPGDPQTDRLQLLNGRADLQHSRRSDSRLGAPGQPLLPGAQLPRALYTAVQPVTVQRELFRNTVFEIGYVGTRGVDLIGTGTPLNPAQICTTASPFVIPAAIGSNVNVPAGTPGVVKNGDGSISITQSTAANANARVPANY